MLNFEERVRRLSPEALTIFKRQLPQRLKEMSSLDRNTALEQLGRLPEFRGLFEGREPVEAPVMPWLQKPKTTWFEQPKVVTERGMEWLGRGISRMPVLPEALEFVAPAFEFIHEKLEKPFAAIVTSPFSPSQVSRPGESWLEREMREYEQWEAPTYVKGIAEFAMPLWWMPWLGWMAKGAKAIAGAEKLAKVGKLIPKIPEQVILPNYEAMGKAIPDDIFKKMALWAKRVPVMSRLVQSVGGPAAFIKRNPQTLSDQARNYAVFRAIQQDMANQIVTVKMPALYTKLGGKSEANLLKITGSKVGVVKTTASKPGVKIGEKVSFELDDVITHPDLYEWTDNVAYGYVKQAQETAEFFERMAFANGVKVPKRMTFRGKDFHYLPRIVEGVEKGKGFEALKRSTDPFRKIVYDTALEGTESGVKYGAVGTFGAVSPVAARVELWGRAVARRIAEQHFNNNVKNLGKTPLQMLEEFAPELGERIGYHTNRLNVLQKAVQGLKLALPLKGTFRPIHDSLLNTISAEFPELAGKIATSTSIRPLSIADYITKMSKSAQRVIIDDARPLVEALKKLPQKASLDDALNTVLKFAKNEQKAIRLVERIYRQEARAELGIYRKVIRDLVDDAGKMLQQEKVSLAPYKKEMAKWKPYYSAPRLGEFEAVFRQNPAFGNRIFPNEVMDVLKPFMTDRGQQWVKNMAQISGTSRMLVAALDLSAPFIQGLMVFGSNPVAWAKSTFKMFQIAKNPQKLYIELAKREASRMDRILHGGSSAVIDFFEAMPILRRGAGRIAGVRGERVVAQTYGRAEAAFLGFGELARDELWKTGRFMIMKKGLAEAAQEKQLSELARTLDRMTGIMSLERLGIGLTQRQVESAWVFFAPRYTRAGFSFLGDMLKGGFTGGEARKAMAGYLGGALTMYMGVSYALGQKPDFNPMSGRFMTVEIGGRHIGVGGFYYSFMRFLANATATAVKDLAMLSPLNLSRLDNPFYKFMYSRTAPLTGLIVGLAIEQKDYLGLPFESGADYLQFMADKVTPIAMQPIMPWVEEREKRGAFVPTTVAAEVAGLRTFPQSDWQRRDIKRDELAQEKYGMTWDELASPQGPGRMAQLIIERESPELQEIGERAAEFGSKLARGEGKVWDEWRNEGQAIEQRYQDAINLASQEFQVTGDGTLFRKKVDDITKFRRELYDIREQNPEFAIVDEYFNEPLDEATLRKMNPKDLARREYYQMMYSPDMYDQFGNYLFDEADRREALFIQKYGQSALDYVQEYMGAKWDEPPALKALRDARRILEPYWEIESQIWSQYPSEYKQISEQIKRLERTDPRQAKLIQFQYPQILWARRRILLERKRLKLQNPQMAMALNTFYRY